MEFSYDSLLERTPYGDRPVHGNRREEKRNACKNLTFLPFGVATQTLVDPILSPECTARVRLQLSFAGRVGRAARGMGRSASSIDRYRINCDTARNQECEFMAEGRPLCGRAILGEFAALRVCNIAMFRSVYDYGTDSNTSGRNHAARRRRRGGHGVRARPAHDRWTTRHAGHDSGRCYKMSSVRSRCETARARRSAEISGPGMSVIKKARGSGRRPTVESDREDSVLL